jgi:hypothetical protein
MTKKKCLRKHNFFIKDPVGKEIIPLQRKYIPTPPKKVSKNHKEN